MNWRTRRTKYSPSCPLVQTSGRKYRTVLTTGRDENTNCQLGNEHTISTTLTHCYFARLTWRYVITSTLTRHRHYHIWQTVQRCIADMNNFLAFKVDLIAKTHSSSSSFGFSHQGSPQRIFFLQFLLSNVSSSVTSTSAMSSFTTSINLLFGLPRFLFPPKVSIPSQSCLSCFLSKLSHLCCPSDVLIPDLVHSCHS